MTDSRKEDDKMNVLMINGSPNAKGCTFTALTEIGKTLQTELLNIEIMQLGKQPIRDCINCNRCHGEGCIFRRRYGQRIYFRKQKMLTDLCLELPSITHIQAADYYLF